MEPEAPQARPQLVTRSLILWIETSSCKCGQRWTNSYLTYNMGGTPTPHDEDKLQVERIIPTQRNQSHCFRCAPLGLGIGWTKPEPRPQAVQPAQQTVDSLLE